MQCVNINLSEFKDLVQKTGIPSYELDFIISKWQEANTLDRFPTPEEALKTAEQSVSIKYEFKILNAVFNKFNILENLFKRLGDTEVFWNKLQKDLQVPKEQVQLLRDSEGKTLDEKLVSFAANYSYTIEINTAKTRYISDEAYYTPQIEEDGTEEGKSNGLYDVSFNNGTKIASGVSLKEAVKLYEEVNKKNTQYYSNLTVPGGINYTENEIATPAITPSIKGHAQFSTANGIGWVRSDSRREGGEDLERQYSEFERESMRDLGLFPEREVIGGTPTKTRRILEIQSDLFQKGRNRAELIKDYEDAFSGMGEERPYDQEEVDEVSKKFAPKNQFLQLLNKDNNWVTFFVKSIIQDSAKKGYEKVLFPSGNTASKVEGHTTLEEFKKQKENRLAYLNNKYVLLDKDSQLIAEYTSKEQAEQNNKTLEKGSELLKYSELLSGKNEINQIKKELERVEKEGFAALKPIYKFYEETITNILKKQGYNPKLITDEYGNTWYEVQLERQRDYALILFAPKSTTTVPLDNSYDTLFPILLNNKSTTSDVLEVFERSNNPLLAAIAKKYRTINWNNARIVVRTKAEDPNLIQHPAYYLDSENLIVVDKDINPMIFAYTMIHEINHALTVAELLSGSDLAKEFKALFEYAKANVDFKDRELYGFKDELEFIAEIYNKNLINALSKVPAKDGKRYENLFGQIYDLIKNFFIKLLNLTPTEQTLYDQVFALASQIFVQADDRANYQIRNTFPGILGAEALVPEIQDYANFKTIALDFDGTLVKTNEAIQAVLGITPREYYSNPPSEADQKRVFMASEMTPLGLNIRSLIQSKNLAPEKVFVITAGMSRKEDIASLLGIPSNNVIIVTDPEVIKTHGLVNEVPVDKAIILSTLGDNVLFIDDRRDTIRTTEDLNKVTSRLYTLGKKVEPLETEFFEADGYDVREEDLSSGVIDPILKKNLLSTINSLKERKKELARLFSGENKREVQNRITLLNNTIERLKKEASYSALFQAAFNSLNYANKIISKAKYTPFDVYEALRIGTDLQFLTQDLASSDLTPLEKQSAASIRDKNAALFSLLKDKMRELFLDAAGKNGLQVSSGDLDKLQRDISALSADYFSTGESKNPLVQIGDAFMKMHSRETQDSVYKYEQEEKALKKKYTQKEIDSIFENGMLINPYTLEYYAEIALLQQELKDIRTEEFASEHPDYDRINEKQNEIFRWYRDNHDYYLTEHGKTLYENRIKAEEEIAGDDTDAQALVAITKYKYSPYHVISQEIGPDGKVEIIADEIPVNKFNGKYQKNTHWHKYLRLQVKEGSKYHNPKYQLVKDHELYKFFVSKYLESIGRQPNEVTLDVGNYEKFLRNFVLDLTKNRNTFKNVLSGLRDTFGRGVVDSFTVSITKEDVLGGYEYEDSRGNKVFVPTGEARDIQGRLTPAPRAAVMSQITKYSNDPFDVLNKFFRAALVYEHAVSMTPMLNLFNFALENSPGYKSNIINTVIKDFDRNPRAFERTLKNESDRFRYRTVAETAGKTKLDEESVGGLTEEEEKGLLEGSIKNVKKLSTVKTSDTLVNLARVTTLGLNPLASITNLIVGLANTNIHAARGKDFTDKELNQATSLVFHHIFKWITFGKKTTKTSLKIVNALHYFHMVKNTNETQNPDIVKRGKERFEQFMYAMIEGGEQLISAQILIASMKFIKVKDLKGNERNLWDMFDEDMNIKPEFGEQEEWKSLSVLDADNKNTSKLLKLTNRIEEIRKTTQGDYMNPIKAKEVFWKRILIMFRMWIPQAIRNRLGEENGDFKGRYLSGIDQMTKARKQYKGKAKGWLLGIPKEFLLSLGVTVAKMTNLHIPFTSIRINNWVSKKLQGAYEEHLTGLGLSTLDIENIRANMRELQLILWSILLYTAIKGMGDDDDKLRNYTYNLTLRVYQDLSFFLNPNSALSVIKDPVPMWKTIQNISDVFVQAENLIQDYESDEITRGKHKGESKFLNTLSTLIPPFTAIHRTENTMNQLFGSQSYKYIK